MTDEYDVIIVGAGFVGLTLAFAFANTNKRVAVIEAKQKSEKKQQHNLDSRALALSFKSKQILEQLQIWPHLEPQTIKEVHISEQGGFGKLYLTAKEQQLDALGYVVRAHQLGETLLNLCEAQKNITWFCPQTLEDVQQDAEKISAILNQQKNITAQLLIIAEGVDSLSRTQQAFDTWTRDYEQIAQIGNISLSHANANTAYQRFTNEGTIALLPLGDKRFTLVWTVKKDFKQELSDQDFLKKIQALIGFQLGTAYDLGPRQSYPLKAVFVEKAYDGRLLLMGNAAHTLNPIAAQGFNLTLRDIECLLNESSLAKYQAKRLDDQKNMLRFTDSLVDLSSMKYGKHLRSFGLSTLNYLPFAKRRLYEHLLGYA
ncbi:MAG: FAD-dependent monooxygenase [Gammaproteobacteria bacterium]|jgi:2-octaprenyl-6-methoxyphenol hydroxylase